MVEFNVKDFVDRLAQTCDRGCSSKLSVGGYKVNFAFLS